MSKRDRQLERAFIDLARAVTSSSTVTGGPPSSTVRGVVITTTPLTVRVGIAQTATPAVNTDAGYTPAVGHVVVISRVGRRQFITGRIS